MVAGVPITIIDVAAVLIVGVVSHTMLKHVAARMLDELWHHETVTKLVQLDHGFEEEIIVLVHVGVLSLESWPDLCNHIHVIGTHVDVAKRESKNEGLLLGKVENAGLGFLIRVSVKQTTVKANSP